MVSEFLDRLDARRTEERRPGKEAAAWGSVIAAGGLTVMKVIVGLLTGSLGILAEAAHSGLDLAAAVVTLLAVRVANRPADETHHYGHGKVENLSALAETALLVVTCSWISYEAIQRLFFTPVPIQASIWGFGVMGISLAVSFSRARTLDRAARRHQSQALAADALNFKTDVWTSVVVLVGLGLVRIGGFVGREALFAQADAVAALGVAAVIFVASLRIARRSLEVLVDRAPTALTDQITAAVADVAGVVECRQVRARKVGPQIFVDTTIGVAHYASFEESHAIASAVEARVRRLAPHADVVVHVEPAERRSGPLMERIRAIGQRENLTVHHITMHEIDDRLSAHLHLEVSHDLHLREAHRLASHLEEVIQGEIPELDNVDTHIEPARADVERGEDITRSTEELVARIERLAESSPGVRDCHDVTVERVDGELRVSLHCLFDADRDIDEVHVLSSQLERDLRAKHPELDRILIHPEPYSVAR